MSSSPILIAGGGIAGLAVALAIARAGLACMVLERRAEFAETGAGIQLGPNGMKALRALGLDEVVLPFAGYPQALNVNDGPSGRRLTSLPLGDWMEARHGAPYITLLRAHLHGCLLRAVRAQPLITIMSGFEVARVSGAVPGGLNLQSADGRMLTGSALIGADGLWSAVRAACFGDGPPVFTGKAAIRAVVPMQALPERFHALATTLWLSPTVHALYYPLRGQEVLGFVAILHDATALNDDTWTGAMDLAAVRQRLKPLEAHVAPLMDAAGTEHVSFGHWSIYSRPLPPSLNVGCVALVGDAAHPILPFLAQGGVLALEDAVVLGSALKAKPDDIEEALAQYSRARLARVRKVAAASKRNGEIYRMRWPLVLARNAVMGLTPPERLMRGYDWLYGWVPPEA